MAKPNKALYAAIIIAIIVAASVFTSFYFNKTKATATHLSHTETSTTTSSMLGIENCSENPTYGDQWLTYKQDPQRTGYSEYNFSQATAGKFLGQLAWQDKGLGLTYEMVSMEAEVFAANYYLNALNLSNGQVSWSLATGAGPYPPVSSDGKLIYLGSNLGGLESFVPSTGQSTLVSNQVEDWGATAICGDVAYATSSTGFGYPSSPTSSMLALNLTSGKAIWGVNLTSVEFSGWPTTDGRLVYSSLTNNTVVAFEANSGNLAWQKSSEDSYQPYNSPV